MTEPLERSPKSYGTAVSLCGIFGVLGVHHFYLGDFWHGMADLGLFVLAIIFFTQGNQGLGTLVILADVLHSVVIFYLLIVEKWRDGKGRPVLLAKT